MRRAGAAVFVLGLAFGSAHAQSAAGPAQSQPVPGAALEKLKLERLEQSSPAKLQLLKAGQSTLRDPAIREAFERDLARVPALEAMESLRVRQVLADSVQLASDPDLAASLELAGYSVDGLRRVASGNALEAGAQLEALEQRFGRDKLGRMTLGASTVMIVRPQPMFPDNFAPGILPTGPALAAALNGHRIDDMVWRRGLTYAAALSTSGSRPVIYCSGTVIARQWLLTAAHCLTDISPGKPPGPDTLRVYLPFQGGTEQVLTAAGQVNRDMKAVRVDQVTWIGEEIGVPYPASEQAIHDLSSQGADIALLRLNAQDVKALPNAIPDVRLAGRMGEGIHSLVGYGRTVGELPTGLSLLVGLREDPPYDVDNVLYYGKAEAVGNGGICSGDSGGGAFAGRVNGTQARLDMVGVISALSDSGGGTSTICLAGTQMLSSVVSARNRTYLCGKVPEACKQ